MPMRGRAHGRIAAGSETGEADPWGEAMALFEALSRPGRLAVFRAILEAGPEGIGPPALVRRLGTTGSALTFHLRALSEVGLVQATPSGRWDHGARPVVLTASLDALDRFCQRLHEDVAKGEAIRQAAIKT